MTSRSPTNCDRADNAPGAELTVFSCSDCQRNRISAPPGSTNATRFVRWRCTERLTEKVNAKRWGNARRRLSWRSRSRVAFRGSSA